MKVISLVCILALSPASCAQAQTDRERELYDKLVQASLENLALKLERARKGEQPGEELAILLAALRSELSEVRGRAFLELGTLPEEARKGAVPEIVRLYPGHTESFKIRALTFLGRVPTPEAEGAVLAATSDPAPAVRRAAAAALKGSPGEAPVRALGALLRDPDREVRIAAADALAAPRREPALGPLLEALEAERDESVLTRIAGALGTIGMAEAVEPLLGLLDRSPRDGTALVLHRQPRHDRGSRAAQRLRPYLAPHHPLTLREVTLQALGKMRDADSLERMAAILRGDPEPRLRQAAATAVGQLADEGALTAVLLPAYLRESAEPVVRALWDAILATLAPERFEPHEKAASLLLREGRREEAEQICLRLHAIPVEEAWRARYLTLEEAVARGAFDAGDFRAALTHYRQFLGHAPGRADVMRKIALCARELGDVETALRTFREIDAKLVRGEGEWWENRMEILATLERGRDVEPLIEEAHQLLQINPSPHPEARRKLIEETLRAAVVRLLQQIAERDEPARRAALQAAQRLGRRIVPTLASELEGEPRLPAAALEAGNLVTGTAHDPATRDPARLRQIAAEWRAWIQRAR